MVTVRTGKARFARSRRSGAPGVIALVLALLAAVLVPLTAGAGAATAAGSWFGLIAPTAAQQKSLTDTQVRRVVLGLGWNQLEPQAGQYDMTAAAALKAQIADYRGKGIQVVLDMGLQYAPSWVFSLPGQTRFVNQYGQSWHGGTGEDVPNAVFNQNVRAAQQAYVTALGSYLGPQSLVGVRVGGLLYGELRYPAGGSNLLWDYDSEALKKAPYPNWRPGSGTPAQARASLQYYFDSLTGYQSWLMGAVNAAFPGVNQQVMLPSWGLRPGMADDAAANLVRGTTVGEVNGMVSMGLDWDRQVAAIKASGLNATVYSTWLDAPAQGSTVQQITPIEYLARLAGQYDLPLAGENAGGGGTDALMLCLTRVKALGLQGMMYFAGPFVADGSAGVDLPTLAYAATLI